MSTISAQTTRDNNATSVRMLRDRAVTAVLAVSGGSVVSALGAPLGVQLSRGGSLTVLLPVLLSLHERGKARLARA